jgi:hypothetical protein
VRVTDRNDLDDSHFKFSLSTLTNLGFQINKSKTIPPTLVAICLGISFNIETGALQIHHTIYNRRFFLSVKFLFQNQKSLKKQLQALVGSLMFLRMAIKPAPLFVSRCQGPVASMTNNEGTCLAADG